MSRRRGGDWQRELARDLFYAESDAMRRMAARGVPLADFEDRAGRLPGDSPAADLLDRCRRHGRAHGRSKVV